MIAAFVCSAVASGASGIWLMAHSNIAVKNIAEKLADVGFDNWRLLVSDEFHCDWYGHLVLFQLCFADLLARHSHLYQKVAKNVITSGEFKPKLLRGRLDGVPVLLSTLSMLSNPKIGLFTRVNPVRTVVVDEASQIPLGDYIAPLQTFPTIHKICMIGDDKQCESSVVASDDYFLTSSTSATIWCRPG